MQAQARSNEGWPSPPAGLLPREANKEEARSRCPSPRKRRRYFPYRVRTGIAGVHQFPAGAEGERALMRAVLVDAIRCLVGEVSPPTACVQLRGQARLWVRSHDGDWPFSFENICAALDLQAERLRRLLLGAPDVMRPVCRVLIERLAP